MTTEPTNDRSFALGQETPSIPQSSTPSIATYELLYAEYKRLRASSDCDFKIQSETIKILRDQNRELREALSAKQTVSHVEGVKCIVHGCSNHTDQGKFVFNLCLPCFKYLASGEIGCTDSFLSKLPKLQSERDQLKVANEELRKLILSNRMEDDLINQKLTEENEELRRMNMEVTRLSSQLSVDLTTANKVIDQCEEALKFYAQEWHTETGDLNYDLSIAVYTKAREALSTIQSLKLKGK